MRGHETYSDTRFEMKSPEGLVAQINTNGAFLESLLNARGEDLIFPRQTIEGKDRGGIPVCAPIFESGERVGLAQHGFARNIHWDILAQSAGQAVLGLSDVYRQLPDISKDYEEIRMELAISLANEALSMSLLINNDSLSRPMIVTPGFHPYFPVEGSSADKVTVSTSTETDVQFSEAALLEAPIMQKSDRIEVVNGTKRAIITSNNLLVPVVWSASADKYICVEPTHAGKATRPSTNNLSSYKLAPGASKRFTMQIKWENQ